MFVTIFKELEITDAKIEDKSGAIHSLHKEQWKYSRS